MNRSLFVWRLAALTLCGHMSQAYRILVISPIPSNSHAILGDATVYSLLDAGHEVVYITAYPRNFTNLNVHQVDVSSHKHEFPTQMFSIDKSLKKEINQLDVWNLFKISIDYAEIILKDEAVQKVLTNGPKIDLVIAEWMLNELYAGLATLLDCPLIWFTSTEPHDMTLILVDEARNPAYSDTFISAMPVPFSFFGRANQLLLSSFITGVKTLFTIYEEKALYEKIYAPLMAHVGKLLPSYDEVRFNASLVLSNSHVSMGTSTRLPQNFMAIGGYHINPIVKPLSKNLQKIMDNAKNGVIYFSMGSIVKSQDFPEEMKNELLNMFSGLKQTVIWKFEADFPNLAANIHVVKWANQQAILAHPNCVLFISHGGLLSLTESIHYGKPIIGIPIFGDQFFNVARGEMKGYAKKVDMTYNLANDLKAAIDEMLGNPKYTQKAQALSFVYHDRPMNPRKELAHWAGHVIKTQGAPHLRSPALDVPWYQKMYVDWALVIVIVFLVFQRVLKMLIAKCFGKSESRQMENKKRL